MSRSWFEPVATRGLLGLAAPIVGGMASQVVLNLVDTAMVGRLGPAPQAAVGLGSFTFLVLANVVVCLGTGVQAIAARRDGEGNLKGAGSALDTGLFLAFAIGLPLGWFLSQSTSVFFPYLASDPAVVVGTESHSGGVAYLEIRTMALGIVGANFCFRGFYNGIGKSSVYLVSIVVIQVLNVFFNWVFIYGNLGAAPMEVRGAALASVLAAVIGTCFYCFLTLVQSELREQYRPFRLRNLTPDGLGSMFMLSWPEAVRGVGVLASFLLFLELHEAVSTTGLAAGAILVNLGSAGFLPARGMGLAGATMVGRHLGRGDPQEARKMVWLGVRLTGLGMLVLGGFLALLAEPVLAVFTPDPVTLATAKPALLLIAVVAVVDTLPVVLMYSLLGAGSTRWVAVVQLLQQYVVMLPLAWFLGLWLAPSLYPGQEAMQILGLWLGLGLSRALLGIIAILRFQGDKWESVEV